MHYFQRLMQKITLELTQPEVRYQDRWFIWVQVDGNKRFIFQKKSAVVTRIWS